MQEHVDPCHVPRELTQNTWHELELAHKQKWHLLATTNNPNYKAQRKNK
jgi:hypothetical protein